MKKGHLIFESVLIIITGLFGAGTLFSMIAVPGPNDIGIIAALWLIALGVLQLIHSLVLAGGYWHELRIRKFLLIYFVGVGIDFLLIYLTVSLLHSDDLGMLTIIVLPLLLALFLWYITYRFRENVSTSGEQPLHQNPGPLE